MGVYLRQKLNTFLHTKRPVQAMSLGSNEQFCHRAEVLLSMALKVAHVARQVAEPLGVGIPKEKNKKKELGCMFTRNVRIVLHVPSHHDDVLSILSIHLLLLFKTRLFYVCVVVQSPL
jgi:hypothetical protein